MATAPLTPAVLLMGPTAAGKSGLSLQIADALAARGQTAEIVSVDSAQVYRGMDIGTAKPDAATRARIPHHLLDICDPAEPYSAARFADDARNLLAQIRARGHLPLLVGGTMLYFRALTQGLSVLPAADPALRRRIADAAAAQGWPAMHAHLAQLDPATAQRLHPNDSQRIQRALEVVQSSGRALSELHGSATAPDSGPYLRLAVMPPQRADLHARIAQRLEQMFADGFVDEVARLHSRPDLHAELPSVRAVGYRQVWAYLEGRCDLAGARQKALEATRQLAKRQITWLRSEHDLCWLNPEQDQSVEAALRLIDDWPSGTPC